MTVPVLASYIDIESAVIEVLAGLGTLDVNTPSDLLGNLPFIRVMRVGGNDNRITDTARIDIDVFDVQRTVASSLSRQVQQTLLAFPHSVAAGVIDEVTTTLSPSEVPWSNTSIQLFAASYTVTARRP